MAAPQGAAILPLGVKIAWALAALLGGVLLFAGLVKAVEPQAFIKQIADYKILPWPQTHLMVAWAMLGIEAALGAALLVGYRLRLMLTIACVLFVIFLGAVGWAWMSGATADCGCFGSWVKRTPGQAFAEDAALLAGGLAAWWLARQQTWHNWKEPWRLSVVSGFACVGLVVPVFYGILADPAKLAATQSENIFQTVKITGLSVDLQKGEHLLAVISTECEHCQASVPTFNSYLEGKNPFSFVAVCVQEEWKRKFFAERFKAKFPLGQISQADFDRILGSTGDTPHIVYLRSGKVIKTWDTTPPTLDELQKVRNTK
ncbi:MAG: hypothetical protein K1Y36_04295 [Blastocatellia bacterium]|nr:hypothetical protein [Blastocatellia bacterium]